MKNPWVIIGIITVVLFGGAILLSKNATESSNEGVEMLQHIKGNVESPIKVVEYSDFQCPACGAFQPIITQVLEEYGDSISFEYKHFPLSAIHPNALGAGVASEAAGQQGKFFEFHDLLFANQQEWSASPVPTTFFVAYAGELGLDVDKFKKHMKSTLLRDKVRAEFEEGRALDVTGTPSFFLNGQKMQFQSYEEFVGQIAKAVDPSLNSSVENGGQPASESGVKFGL